jgi:two-component system, chemotaxis family, protein-glutamate methylesterase/glutaminase
MVGQITKLREDPRSAEPAAGARQFDIVVIASSLGGIEALRFLVAGLPAHFPLPIVICQHLAPDKPSLLPLVLARKTRLRVVTAEHGEQPVPGCIYVAPPGRHLLVQPGGRFGWWGGERVNFCRPSADVLFRSTAEVYGARAMGVVLTGYGQDGALGARAIQQRGGYVIAQDEASSESFDMPRAARDIGGADLVLPLSKMAAALEVLGALPAEPAAIPA